MSVEATINILMANSVLGVYKEKRYGIKSCASVVDPELAADFKIIHTRSAERQACSPDENEATHLAEIEEKINTL